MAEQDRRVHRTQTALQQALIELILEKGFDETNVSEIAARANVGRSTFYAHYADKEDLLQGSVEGMRSFLDAAMISHPGRGVHPALAFVLPMLEHAAEQRQLFTALVGRRGGQLLQELIHDVWADVIRSNWDGGDELAIQAIAGAFGATISWWMLQADALTPEEVDRRFRAVVEGSLTTIATTGRPR